MTGFGRAQLQGARGLPSWERLTAEAIAISGLTIFVALGHRRVMVIAMATCALLTIGFFVLARQLSLAIAILLAHSLPFLLPVVLLGWAINKRSRELVFLLGFAVTLRLRRGFENTDWQHILIEVPIYFLLLHRFRPGRSSMPAAAILSCMAVCGYWYFGRGPLTRRNDFAWVQTARGPVRWISADADLYYELKPHIRKHPAFAFAYTGGFNYYFQVPNPSPSGEGVIFSGQPADILTRRIAAQKPLYIDTDYYDRLTIPVATIKITSWALPREPNYFLTVERKTFSKLVSGCTKHPIPLRRPWPRFWIFSCE
jgi:hypothetical protein